MVTVKAALHEHLKTRSDMTGILIPLLKRARARLGEDGIVAVVDFNNFGENSRYNQLLKQAGNNVRDLGFAFYSQEYRMYILKGQEVPTEQNKTRQGHLLVLGLDRNVHLDQDKPLEDTLKEARDLDAIVIADHPYYPHEGIGTSLKARPELLKYLDGWEIHNGEASLFRGANKKAREAWQEYKKEFPNLGAVSCSDGHSLREIGGSYTLLDIGERIESKDSVREAIRKAEPHHCHEEDNPLGALLHIATLSPYIVGGGKLGVSFLN